ncbi:hypothetical protein B0H10DRAFT_1986924 [Mycena sp. CBHHK59/15]|nr:hypothetical protein B0H10DRAFT_1986924 [Mycena sp. CBHHK59/15]
MLHEITLKIAFQDSDNEACETRVTLKTDETFDHSFRHMEVLCGKKKGSIAFAYKRKWLEQTDTPQELGLQDGDVIDCVSVIILVIVRADARSRYFTADPSDVSLTFSTLFASYGVGTPSHEPFRWIFTFL